MTMKREREMQLRREIERQLERSRNITDEE